MVLDNFFKEFHRPFLREEAGDEGKQQKIDVGCFFRSISPIGRPLGPDLKPKHVWRTFPSVIAAKAKDEVCSWILGKSLID
ncbi:hypothetical protein ACHAW6_009317 [Cyclotella cf. meneghiniana]